MPLWESLAGLRVRVDHYELERRELTVPSGWTRVTTTVALQGDGETGHGEDVTYVAVDHEHVPPGLMLAGTWTLEDLSRRLDELPLWGGGADEAASIDYRRWAFESAVLDLALRQAGASLADAVGRPYRPVRFIASTRSAIEPYV
jgi:L-alanine-DL-glutamate epimerase-like enolase superfamily enzyme